MLKPLLRLTVVTFIWKNYRRIIASTFALFTFFWLVGFAHREYLDFAKHQPAIANIQLSFYVKWFALLCGIIVYFIYHRLQKKTLSTSQNTMKKQTSEPDPFEAIRNKKNLTTRAEKIIKEK